MQPPTHRIDAVAEFISITDPAWDLERVGKERERMEAEGQDPDDHPFSRYAVGASRFDLDATANVCGTEIPAREYLKGTPLTWTLRRLSMREYRSIQTMYRRDDLEGGNERAVLLGLQSVSGPKAPRLHEPIGQADLEAIWERSPLLIEHLALAVMAHSKPISWTEGKA